MSPDICIRELKSLVDMTIKKFPNSQICIGEALPRELDSIQQTSDYLKNLKSFNQKIPDLNDNVYIVKHRNIDLRYRNLWSDSTHLSNTGMARLIQNYK